jgi:UDP-N-acetylmuramate--alanine ligase
MKDTRDLLGKKVHFIGIGGVSMSGIAKCFAQNGILVQGSDSALSDSKYTNHFEKLGIKLFASHEYENITRDVFLVVKTSTVPDSNPEIIQAKEFGIKVIERFEALELIISQFEVRIGISGSSGKTTTTALCWEAMKFATNEIPSCIIGTVLNEVNSSVFVNNNSNICVVEADESDGSFADMNFTIAVITDIDTDHLDHKRYEGKREILIEHFHKFAKNALQNNGIVIFNANCKTTTELMQSFVEYKDSIFSYSGIDKVASFKNIHEVEENSIFQNCYLKEARNLQNAVEFSCGGLVELENIKIPMIGKLNAFNAIPGLIISSVLFSKQQNNAFENFKGANKRVEIVGEVEVNGKSITVIDDYAHSPKKIKAFIDSFSSYCSDINAGFVIICEPHKYTRVQSLYEEYLQCFDGCNCLLMMEIFGIQGKGIQNDISSGSLVHGIEQLWSVKKKNSFIKNLKSNKSILSEDTFGFVEEFFGQKHKMFYVFLGAGYSNKYAHLLYEQLKKQQCFQALKY